MSASKPLRLAACLLLLHKLAEYTQVAYCQSHITVIQEMRERVVEALTKAIPATPNDKLALELEILLREYLVDTLSLSVDDWNFDVAVVVWNRWGGQRGVDHVFSFDRNGYHCNEPVRMRHPLPQDYPLECFREGSAWSVSAAYKTAAVLVWPWFAAIAAVQAGNATLLRVEACSTPNSKYEDMIECLKPELLTPRGLVMVERTRDQAASPGVAKLFSSAKPGATEAGTKNWWFVLLPALKLEGQLPRTESYQMSGREAEAISTMKEKVRNTLQSTDPGIPAVKIATHLEAELLNILESYTNSRGAFQMAVHVWAHIRGQAGREEKWTTPAAHLTSRNRLGYDCASAVDMLCFYEGSAWQVKGVSVSKSGNEKRHLIRGAMVAAWPATEQHSEVVEDGWRAVQEALLLKWSKHEERCQRNSILLKDEHVTVHNKRVNIGLLPPRALLIIPRDQTNPTVSPGAAKLLREVVIDCSTALGKAAGPSSSSSNPPKVELILFVLPGLDFIELPHSIAENLGNFMPTFPLREVVSATLALANASSENFRIAEDVWLMLTRVFTRIAPLEPLTFAVHIWDTGNTVNFGEGHPEPFGMYKYFDNDCGQEGGPSLNCMRTGGAIWVAIENVEGLAKSLVITFYATMGPDLPPQIQTAQQKLQGLSATNLLHLPRPSPLQLETMGDKVLSMVTEVFTPPRQELKLRPRAVFVVMVVSYMTGEDIGALQSGKFGIAAPSNGMLYHSLGWQLDENYGVHLKILVLPPILPPQVLNG